MSDREDNSDDKSERALARRSDSFEVADADLVADRKEVAAHASDGKPVTVAKQTSLQVTASYFSGPLPRPEIFKAYEDACPGAGDRILRMSEQEGEHRRALEKRSTEAEIATQRRAQIFGFSAYVLTMVMGGALLLLGVPAVGITMVIGSLATMVGSAIWNRVEETKQRKLEERKQQAREEQAKREAEKKEKNNKKGKKR